MGEKSSEESVKARTYEEKILALETEKETWKQIRSRKEKYWTDLISILDAIEPGDQEAYCETVFAWAKLICTDSDARKEYAISTRDEYLSDLFLRTILFFYSYLKKKSDDMKWINKVFLYLLDIKLRPFLEDNHESCPRNNEMESYPDGGNYFSLLKIMVKDQLLLGKDGWKCLRHYSFYDDYCNPLRCLNIKEAEDVKDITNAFSESLGIISDVLPAEVMTFYKTTPLSRMVSLTSFNEIMRDRYKDEWDVNGILSDLGFFIAGHIMQDDVEPYRIKVSENSIDFRNPQNGELRPFYAGQFEDYFIKDDDTFYRMDDYSLMEDYFSSTDEWFDVGGYTWEELDVCDLVILAGETIRIRCCNTLIGNDHKEADLVRFRLKNEISKKNVGTSGMISDTRLVFSVDSIDFDSDGVVLTGNNIQGKDLEKKYVLMSSSILRHKHIEDLEVAYDANGVEKFYSDDNIKKSLIKFVRSYIKADMCGDDEMYVERKRLAVAECERLAVVIGNACKYNKNLPDLIDEVEDFKSNDENEMFQSFRNRLREYFDRNFLYGEGDQSARDALALRMRLYEYHSCPAEKWIDDLLIDEIDNTIFNHGTGGLFGSESKGMRPKDVQGALETEKFWYLSFQYLRKHSTAYEWGVYYSFTLRLYWDAVRFKMAHSLSNDCKDYISKIIKLGLTLAEGEDMDPIVPLVVMTLNRDQLKEVIKRAFGDSSDISLSEVMDRVILPKTELRWRELYFRLRMLSYSSVEEIIDTFILLVHEMDIKDCYISSLILTIYQDITEMEKNSGETCTLKLFLERMAAEYPFESNLVADSESDLFRILENEGDSAYTIRRKELVRYLLITYAADGLSMLRAFSKVDPLAGRRFGLDQAQRIGTFRIIQANIDGKLIELFGGADNSPRHANAITDDKEDEVLDINTDFRKAVIDAYRKGYEVSELFDAFFDTCLSSYIRLDIFNKLMGEIYGEKWDINKEIERVKPFRITGLINELNNVDTLVTNPWVPESIIHDWDMRRLGDSKRPEKAFTDYSDVTGPVLYIHNPGIRVVNDIIRLELGPNLEKDDYERFIGITATIRIDKFSINDNGEVVAIGALE